MNSRVLVIEDDKEINGLLCKALQDNGYISVSAFTGIEGLDYLRTQAFEIVLLDLMLPFTSGDIILQELRKFSNIPVIVISAKELTQTKIDLLRLGADDYITKPFDLNEILARIESNLRRTRIQSELTAVQILRYKDIKLDCVNHIIMLSDYELSFTAKEFEILELLMKHPDKVYSKANLFQSIWNEEYLPEDNTLNVHISNIRNKLKIVNPDERYIETVWGIGYRLYKECVKDLQESL